VVVSSQGLKQANLSPARDSVMPNNQKIRRGSLA